MDESTAAVVKAARVAFARYGVDRTRMADVAAEAQLARQTLYDFVAGRDELIELALVDCCRELQERLDTDLSSGPWDLRERFIETLAAALPTERVDRVIGAATAVQSLLGKSLRPVLQRAHEAGQLRPEVVVAEASQWLLGVISFALLRENLDASGLRREFRIFALPAIFIDADTTP